MTRLPSKMKMGFLKYSQNTTAESQGCLIALWETP